MSKEATWLIINAFILIDLSRSSTGDSNADVELKVAELRFSDALQKFKSAYPDQGFCVWGQRSELLVLDWTVRAAASGHPIPAAERMAEKIEYDMPRAVAAKQAAFQAARATE